MRHPAIYRFLFFVLVLQAPLCIPQDKKHTLLAAPYPGSVVEPYGPPVKVDFPTVPIESRMQTFYSKDSFEKVKAHYEKSAGKFEPAYDDVVAYYAAVVPPLEVMKYLEGKGVLIGEGGSSVDTRGDRAGVTIFDKPKNYVVTVVTVLDGLKSAYTQRFIGVEGEDMNSVMEHLEDPELTKVLGKYEHVKWSYFQTVNGRPMNEVIHDKHYKDADEALVKEQGDLVKRMNEATAAGKYDEATKVSERMMEISMLATDPNYNWNRAIKCLDDLQLNAYATKIVIDRPLAEWELPPAKK